MKKTIRTLTALVVLGLGTVAFTTGCTSTSTGKSTGEYIDDAGITTRVKAAFLRDPMVSFMDVGVDTFKGTVQLNGFVDTAEQRSRAEQIAASVPGVVSVQNQLTVKTQTPGSQNTQNQMNQQPAPVR